MVTPAPKLPHPEDILPKGLFKDEQVAGRLLRDAQKGKKREDDNTGADLLFVRADRGGDGDKKQDKAPAAFESFELLKRQPKELARYERVRRSLHKLFVALESEVAAGDKVIEMRQQLVELLETETNEAKKKKIQDLLKANPLEDKSKLIKDLVEAYKDDPKRKAFFEKLLPEDNARVALADRIQLLKRGETAANLLKDLVAEKKGFDKRAALFTLVDLLENDADKKVARTELGKLLIADALAGPEGKGKIALERLKLVYKDDKEKCAVIDDLLSGKTKWEDRAPKLKELLAGLSQDKRTLADVLKDVEQTNFKRTKEFYPIAAAFLEKGVTNDVLELGLKMLKGTKKDPNAPFPTHFFEGCPLTLPNVGLRGKEFKATWEGFLTRVALGHEKLTLPRDFADLLSDDSKSARFVNATDWYSKAEGSIARETRIYQASLLNDKLQTQFGAPESWKMPPITDARALDQWYKQASNMNNLMELVTGYVQGYLDLEELDPDIAKQTDAKSPINELRAMGAVIEWDPISKRLTRFELPMVKNLNLKLPENQQIEEDLRGWVAKHHDPIDRAADAYAKGRASWLRYGDFREPVEPGKGPEGKDKKACVIADKKTGQPVMVENCHGIVVTIWRDGEVIHRNRAGKFIDKAGKEVDEPKHDAENQDRVPFDYIRHSFSAKKTDKKDDKGRPIYEVTVERQYCQEGILNFERWGSDIDAVTGGSLVTKFTAKEKLELPEGKRIVVQDSVSHKSQLMRAEDLDDGVGGWRWRQKWLYHHGAKVGDMAVNVGLTVSGGAEIVALKSFGSVALGSLRFVIGATGFLEPALRAGEFDDTLRSYKLRADDVESFRHNLVMLDLWGIQAGGGLLRWVSGARAAEVASAVGRWGKAVETVGKWGHRSIVFGMVDTAPVIGQQIYTDWRDRKGHFGDRNGPLALDDRRIPWEDFLKAHPEFKLSDPKAQKVVKEIFDTYAETLCIGTDNKAVQTNVRKLFEEAKDVMALKPDDPKRQAFIAKLIGMTQKGGDEMLLATLTGDPKYTDRAKKSEDDKGGDPPDAEATSNRDLIAKLGKGPKLADVSQQERIAAMQCLVLLSTKDDGTLPEKGVVGTRTVTIPEHKVKVVKDNDGKREEVWETVKATTVTQNVTIEDALKFLSKTASTGRSDMVSLLRALDAGEPTEPIKYLKGQLTFGEDERDDSKAEKKAAASQYLRKYLYLSTDDAKKFVDDLSSGDDTKIKAAEKALEKLFAERSPANKFLRQQLDITAEAADILLKPLASKDADVRAKAEEALKDKLDVARQASHLAAGDTLWWHGRYKGDYTRELYSICMDIASDKTLPDKLRAKAILDRNCPRLGLLIGEVEALDQALADRPGEQLPSIYGSTNGCTAKDGKALLLSIVLKDGEREFKENGKPVKPKESSDLRAVCALALLANQQEKLEERKAFLGEISQSWEKLSPKPGAYSQYTVDLLKKALSASIDDAPNGSEWRVRKDKLDAAISLASLGKIELGKDSYKLEIPEYNERILESIAVKPTTKKPPKLLFDAEHPELLLTALNNLNYSYLTFDQRKAVINLLKLKLNGEADATKRSDIETAKLIVVKHLPELLKRGQGGKEYDELRLQTRELLEAMFDSNSPLYAGSCPDLKVAAIESLRDIGWRDAKMREFMEDRLHRATTDGRADGPVAKDADGRTIWLEPPAVRLAAIQALYRMNPLDPGKIATGYRDIEDDPLVGRVAQSLEKDRENRKPGDERKEAELTQSLELLLLNANQCSPKPGEEYLKSSRFKDLLQANLDESLAGTLSSVYGMEYKGTVKQGYGYAGYWPFRWNCLTDRVTSLSYGAVEKKYDAAVSSFWKTYSTLSVELCNEALGIPGRDETLTKEQIEDRQKKTMSAIYWLLKDNCSKCLEKDQKVIRTNCAVTLLQLCGMEFNVEGVKDPIIVSNPMRQLAASYVRNLLSDPDIKGDVQLILIDAVHRLHQDGAIDTPTAAQMTVDMLQASIKKQSTRTPKDDDYEDFKKAQLTLLNDLLRYRARFPEAMATIRACANGLDGKGPGHPIPDVKARAKDILGLLSDGVTLTREDVRLQPDEGSSPQARAEALRTQVGKSLIFRALADNEADAKLALVQLKGIYSGDRDRCKAIDEIIEGKKVAWADRAEKLKQLFPDLDFPTEKNEKAKNEDVIVYEIFRSVSGNPITKRDDPRLAVLLALADNPPSPRIRAALGHALLDVDIPDGRALLLGLSILSDLKDNDKTILGKEATERLAVLDKCETCKDLLPLLKADHTARKESVLRAFYEYNAKDQSESSATIFVPALEKMVKEDFAADKHGQDYVKQLAAAWGANGFDTENKALVDVCRQLLTFSTNEKTKLAAAYAIIRSKNPDKLDLESAQAVLKKLQKDGSSQTIKDEATRVLTPNQDFTARSKFEDFVAKVNLQGTILRHFMTDGEIDRASLDRLRQYTQSLTALVDAGKVDQDLLRLEKKKLFGDAFADEAKANKVLTEGIFKTIIEVNHATDPKMSVQDRINAFEKALVDPGKNNENLVRAIFQMNAGTPITDENDPRIALLVRLGQTTQSTLVEQAVAMTLMSTKLKDNRLYRVGVSLLSDVLARGNDDQKLECRLFVNALSNKSPDFRRMWPEIQTLAVTQAQGALFTILDSDTGFGPQPVLKDAKQINEKIALMEKALADKDLPGRIKVRAMADAWVAGDYKDPTKKLLAATRKLALESTDEQVKLAALLLMRAATPILEKGDMELIRTGLEGLATKGANPQVKQEAKFTLDNWKTSSDTLRRDVEKTFDVKMPIDQRIKLFNEALADPGYSNDKLIRAVYQLTAGAPITDAKDARVPLLTQLGFRHPDPRVEQAVGYTLLFAKDSQLVATALQMLADVSIRGGQQEKDECSRLLKALSDKSEKSKEVIDGIVNNAKYWNAGVLPTLFEADSGTCKRSRTTDKTKLSAQIVDLEKTLADPNIQPRVKVQALADAWVAGSYKDPTGTLLALTRKLGTESKDEQVRLAALLLMLKARDLLKKEDLAAINTNLVRLSENGSNAFIKKDAQLGLSQLIVSVESIAKEADKNTDANMSTSDRIAAFEKALDKPGANNDDLIRAIFQLTANSPITAADDSRIALLARVGYTHADPRVEQAVAIALIRTKQDAAFRMGLWMLADVAERGKDKVAKESKDALEAIAGLNNTNKKLVEEVKEEVSFRTTGALFTISDARDGVATQPKLKDKEKLSERIKLAQKIWEDTSLPGRLRVQALTDAWAVGDFKDPTETLLALTRTLATDCKDEQLKLAALLIMALSPSALKDGDLDKVKAGLKDISEKSTDTKRKKEAGYILDLLTKKK